MSQRCVLVPSVDRSYLPIIQSIPDSTGPRLGEHEIQTCSAAKVLVHPPRILPVDRRTPRHSQFIYLTFGINKIRPELFFQPRNHFTFEIEERPCPNKLRNTITKPPTIMTMPPAMIARPQDTRNRITTNRSRITLIPPKGIFITPHITRLKQQNLTSSITATRLKAQESNGARPEVSRLTLTRAVMCEHVEKQNGSVKTKRTANRRPPHHGLVVHGTPLVELFCGCPCHVRGVS